MAIQSAAASCPDGSSDRYVDCGNGTVTDNQTGLVWLANANCLGFLDWFEAMSAVQGLADLPDDREACVPLSPDQCDCGLSDGSSPGEWRLPSIGELETMVDYATNVLGCTRPTISNDAGDGCWDSTTCVNDGSCSFHTVEDEIYWSSSTVVTDPSKAEYMDLIDGMGGQSDKTPTVYYVWPVRGGQ